MANKNKLDSGESLSDELGRIALRGKVEAVRTAVKKSPQLTNQELNRLMQNMHGILERLKRSSPETYSHILNDVFNGSRSQLSKFTNPRSKERRTKLSSYLKKADGISASIRRMVKSDHADASFLEYQAEKVLLELAAGTRLEDQSDARTHNSTSTAALDDLWTYLLEIAAYIDRQTNLAEAYDSVWDFYLGEHQDTAHLFDHFDWFGEAPEDIGPWDLFLRHPICETGKQTLAGTLCVVEVDHDESVGMVEGAPKPIRIFDKSGNQTAYDLEELRDRAQRFEVNFYLRETLDLVLRSYEDQRRLQFAFMLSHDTEVPWLESGDLTIQATRCPGHPYKKSSDDQYYCLDPFFLSEPALAWGEFESVPDPNSGGDYPLLALPDYEPHTNRYEEPEDQFKAMRDYRITRLSLDQWNDHKLPGQAYTWESLIPTQMNRGTLAHFLEFSLIDTAKTAQHFWDSKEHFQLPILVQKAHRRAEDLRTFAHKLHSIKRASREELNRILEGDISLD